MTVERVHLSEECRPAFGLEPVMGRHGLEGDPLFADDALADLIDRYPREHLYAMNMGTDPAKIEENRLAVHDDVSGSELLRAVRNGVLWLNLTRVDRVDARYRRLVSRLYEQLSSQIPDFSVRRSQGTLLISSPNAQVYYHADGPASVLWHVRGNKRVWVYPALDPGYMKRELLEDLFAGVRHEYLPYEAAFDLGARVFDLGPGDWIAWPQNAPHRVVNTDGINVSLSTEHFTREGERRFRVYVANRFFRTRLGASAPSAREDGVSALARTIVQRIARRLGLDPVVIRKNLPVLRVAPDAPGGVVALTPAEANRLASA
jgi:hypothetical protein